MKNDWYEVLHPGKRAKADKPKAKPVMVTLAEQFLAQYADLLEAPQEVAA